MPRAPAAVTAVALALALGSSDGAVAASSAVVAPAHALATASAAPDIVLAQATTQSRRRTGGTSTPSKPYKEDLPPTM